MNKNKIYSILSLMLLAFSLVGTSCRQEDGPSIDDYPLNYEIPKISASPGIKVGALYSNNPFANTNNTYQYDRLTMPYDASITPYPHIGPYVRPVLQKYNIDYRNPTETAKLIQQHINWCIEAGIDYLIMPTVGLAPGNSDYLNTNSVSNMDFLEGKEGTDTEGLVDWHDLKFCLTVDLAASLKENKDTLETSDRLEDDTDQYGYSARLNTLKAYFVGLANHFFVDDDKYFEVDGKPMIVVLNPQDFYCRDSKKVYDAFREAIKDATGKDIYLVARQPQWSPVARYENFFLYAGFDAFYMNTMYQDQMPQRAGEYRPQFIDQNWQYNAQYAKEHANLDFIPSVSPAFNGWVMGSGTNNYGYCNEDYNEDRFRTMCNVAKKNLGDSKMVIIDSFNEWNKATGIEPTDPTYGNGFGTKMLEVVRSEFKTN